MILTFFLANMFAGAVTFSATTVSAENQGVVRARLQRHYVYEASVFEDSVPNVLLNGSLKHSFYIRPQGVDVADARIEMVTPYTRENLTSIDPTPSTEGPVDDSYRYEWAFGSIPDTEQAAVWIHRTNFPVKFQPKFACRRIWNPWITSHSVTQTLTIEFTPSIAGGVHIHPRVESTPEASVTIVQGTDSIDPLLINQKYWLESENGRVVAANWAGDCEVKLYTISVDITVENKLFPEPIFYKPSVGIGFGYDPQDLLPVTSNQVTVDDDIDGDGTPESSITYSGTGSYKWQAIIRPENGVSLPGFSSVVSSFNAGTWNETTYYVDTVSSSTVTDFYFSEDDMLISFNVTGPDGTVGSCRVTIPNELLWVDNPEQWQVRVNNTLIEDRKIMGDTNYTCIYFIYNHSIQEVQIKGIHVIPEFPAWTPILLILTVLSVAITVYKRRILKALIH